MRVKDIKIGEAYNGVKVIEDLGRINRSHIYKVVCPICGKAFNARAERVGETKSCQECSKAHRFIDISGRRFGRLVALERVGRTLAPNGTRRSMWRCQCDCGKESVVKYIALTSGNTRSCGCMEEENRHANMQNAAAQRRKSVSKNFCGNLEAHPLYNTWKSMLMRCNNPNVRGYRHYGGRGIEVCERWSGDLGFENFVNDMGDRPDGTTLDRTNVNGNYEPSNCRWATLTEQANNKTNSVYITVGNKQISAKEFCDALGLNYWVAIKQIQRGYDINYIAKDLRFNRGEYRRRSDLINHNLVVSEEIIPLFINKQFIDAHIESGDIEIVNE